MRRLCGAQIGFAPVGGHAARPSAVSAVEYGCAAPTGEDCGGGYRGRWDGPRTPRMQPCVGSLRPAGDGPTQLRSAAAPRWLSAGQASNRGPWGHGVSSAGRIGRPAPLPVPRSTRGGRVLPPTRRRAIACARPASAAGAALARTPAACARRNTGQESPARRGAGGIPRRRSVVRMAVAETSCPGLSNSPRIRR